MAPLCPTIEDREHDKFTVNSDDETCVRVCGESIPSGLQNEGKITEVVLSSVAWTALPTTSLSNRNAMSVQNESGIVIKINYDNTEPGFVGATIPGGSAGFPAERFYNVTDAITIYAKAASGTPTVTVEELS